MNQSSIIPANAPNLPVIAQPTGDDLISQWLGGPVLYGGFLKTSLDLSTRKGLEIATRFEGASDHEGAELNGKEFMVNAYGIKPWNKTDPKTGEVRILPRCTLSVDDGSILAFSGTIALRSILLLAYGIKPEEWEKGIKIRVHAFKNGFGTYSHRLELMP